MQTLAHSTMNLRFTLTACLLAISCCLLPVAFSGGEVHPAPLLYVRLKAPVGSRITFLEGPKAEQTFDPPVTVGLKPGYAYRLRIDGVPNDPNVKLYPTLEVGGTLRLPPRLKAADFPAIVQFTETDLLHAVAGSFITKVIVVEDPGASPFPIQDPEHPSEWELRPGEDAMVQAKTFGRAVLILRLGLFELGPADLAKLHTGLILYPDMKMLPPQNLPPTVDLLQFYDRRHCVEDPVECVRDGGDRGQPAYFEFNGNLRGVNPSDAVAEYKDSLGGRRLAVTNEVCLYAPRFLGIRHELPPLVIEGSRPVVSLNMQEGNRQVNVKANTRQAEQADELQAVRSRDRLRANLGKNQLMQVIEMQVLEGVDIDVGSAGALGSERIGTLSERDKAKLTKQVELAIKLSQGTGAKAVAEAFGPKVGGPGDGIRQVLGPHETPTALYPLEKR